MKQLQLFFIALFIANLLPAQELQWYKNPYKSEKKKLQAEVNDFLYEDTDNIYFSLPRGKGEYHYREQIYIGYVKMDKSTLETKLLAPTYKELKKGVSLHFPFNGKSYSIIKEYIKKNESAVLSYYTADNLTKGFIKNIDFYGKQNPKDATSNGRILNNQSAIATNSIAYSPDGNHLLLAQYYFSTNIVDITVLDKDMNLVLDKKIILSRINAEPKAPIVNKVFLDNEGNVTILWEAKIDIDKESKKRRYDIVSYYDRSKEETYHKVFPYIKKDVQSVQYEFKGGELNIVAIIGKSKPKINPVPNDKTGGVKGKSLLIGSYDRLNNEWNYQMNDSIIEQLFGSFDIKKGLLAFDNDISYICSIAKVVSKGNTKAISLSFEGKQTFNTLAFFDEKSRELISHYNFEKENWKHQQSYFPIKKIYLEAKGDGFVSFFPSLNEKNELVYYIMTIHDEKGGIVSQTSDTRLYPDNFIIKLLYASNNTMYVEIAKSIKINTPGRTPSTTITGEGSIYSSGGTIYKKRKPQLCKIVF